MIKMQIENGKQLGSSFSFKQQNKTVWSSVGIQKYDGAYKVYIDEIDEVNMDAEDYSREETKEFQALSEALEYIEATTILTFDRLQPCKGQRIFNPKFDN